MYSNGYTLTIIEDEPVALAGFIPTAGSSFFTGTMIVIATLMVIALVLIYVGRAYYYKKQLYSLKLRIGSNADEHSSWRVSRLKEDVAVLQSDLAALNVGDLLH